MNVGMKFYTKLPNQKLEKNKLKFFLWHTHFIQWRNICLISVVYIILWVKEDLKCIILSIVNVNVVM